MAKLNNTDGFITQGWMVKDLGLSGCDLVIFAIINQFSQSKAGIYKGGVSYLCEWTGMTKNSVRKHLKRLEEAGLIKSERGAVNNVQFCYYSTEGVGKKLTHPVAQKVTQGGSENDLPGSAKNDPGVGKKLTPDINNGKQEKDSKRDVFDFASALVQLGLPAALVEDWIKVRRTKRLSQTRTAFDGISKQLRLAAAAGLKMEDCIRTGVENSWGGFKAEWLLKDQQPQSHAPSANLRKYY